MKKFHKIIGLVLPLVMIAFIAGCGGSSSSTPTSASTTTSTDTSSQSNSVSSPTAGQGTLSISLTDAPAAEFLAVYVTIAEVHVHRAGSDDDEGEWIVAATPNATYNLLELQNGITTFLGEKNIPSGDYTQMRLILGNAPVGTTPDGEPHPYTNYIILLEDELPYALTVPSNTLKQNHNFTLIEGSEMNMLIDFDAKKSIHPAGKKWMLNPVITVKTELE